MFGISNKTWNTLSDQQQAILVEAGNQVWDETQKLAVDDERESKAREERITLGITILPKFSDEDVKTFVEASRKAWKEMAEQSGEEGLGYYKKVSDLVK
jgi:TRAP-type C4-dicarboxylate transport system substrate-binding protein